MQILFSVTCGFISACVYEFGGKYILRTMMQPETIGLILYGYRLHHSLYGLAFMGYGFIKKKLFFTGFGIGIIVQHAIFDGFWFITREI